MKSRQGWGLSLVAVALSFCSLAAGQTPWGPNYFPNVTLTTQDGKQVKFYDDLLKGKLVAIDLIYTHCEYSCPLETARMAQVQKLLGDRVGKDIFFYSISIDPVRDTPRELKEYARKFHAGPGWLFLTGNKKDIMLISRKLGLFVDPEYNKDGHAPSLIIGDVPHGQWMQNSAVDNPRFLATTMVRFFDPSKVDASATARNYNDAHPLAMNRGQYLFSTRCASCHTIGNGPSVGPDLRGVTNTRPRNWLARFIATPDRLLAQKDPIATALFKTYNKIQMPNLSLDKEDVEALLDFLASADTKVEEVSKAQGK